MITKNKSRILYIILEIFLSISFGLGSPQLLFKYNWTESLMLSFLLIYLTALSGVAIPGYFYLKKYGNIEIYIGALFTAIAWTFLAFFLYIILVFFVHIDLLASPEAGLIFPVLFGIFGFNHFVIKVEKTLKTRIKRKVP
ncbi:MAG: hypothetical protein CFE24_13940 [Flavobacterium sp. BFFFF2]|nr:MAG: hypothetical protein CFE24_13940 [Flavobacterium sp. BFFFF2]